MSRVLSVTAESFPIAGTFTISRGSKTTADVVTCTITDGDRQGRGECVPYRRYGESTDGVIDAAAAMAGAIAAGMDRNALRSVMRPGAARNAIDCALWDLEARQSGRSVASLLGIDAPRAVETAYTLSLGSPDAMAAQAREQAHRPLLKVKVGGADDLACMRAVRAAAPASRIIIDANEAWTEESLAQNLAVAAELGVALIEQPLPAGKDDALAAVEHRVPICADESLHVAGDLERLLGRYDAVNIKLDKTGGLTEALELKMAAQRLGFRIMVGCMVGTSLAMAPAVLLAHDADFVDLDGPLLLARDREPGLVYEGSIVSPPMPELWG